MNFTAVTFRDGNKNYSSTYISEKMVFFGREKGFELGFFFGGECLFFVYSINMELK